MFDVEWVTGRVKGTGISLLCPCLKWLCASQVYLEAQAFPQCSEHWEEKHGADLRGFWCYTWVLQLIRDTQHEESFKPAGSVDRRWAQFGRKKAFTGPGSSSQLFWPLMWHQAAGLNCFQTSPSSFPSPRCPWSLRCQLSVGILQEPPPAPPSGLITAQRCHAACSSSPTVPAAHRCSCWCPASQAKLGEAWRSCCKWDAAFTLCSACSSLPAAGCLLPSWWLPSFSMLLMPSSSTACRRMAEE